MTILIETPLLFAHPFKFGFSFGRIKVLPLQFNNKRFLLCQSPLSFNDIALYLSQLIAYRSRVHRDPHAAVLRMHVGA
ncbi:hypothetical protein [Bradyrhizobium japonicum]|uniref:hypothetical protein n=1 Tax=Bradyrhizobium japonicum TaxID=375 RepID=UPI0004ACEF43|nr:hypothetical protein [Bradyrhizobium japonicum]